MHLREIEAFAVGQDGRGPSPVAEGPLRGAASNSPSRPHADTRERQLSGSKQVFQELRELPTPPEARKRPMRFVHARRPKRTKRARGVI